MRRLVPYPVLLGDIKLDVREARLDDVPLPYSMISAGQRVVALHEIDRTEWESARLSLRVRAPEHELEAGPWTDVSCVAVLTERRTNARSSVRLRKADDGSWAGEVALHRDRHMSRAELTAHVVGTVGGIEGRVIGTVGDSWLINLQERAPVRHKSVKTVWADFGSEDNPHLNALRLDPWTVEAVGDEPVLYLNMSFEGLERLLKSTRGTERAARDAVATQIAADVWTTLFSAAMYAAEVSNGQPEWPGGWQESTLRRMLPDVFPDRSPNDALLEVVARRQTGDGGGDLQTRLLHAASKQAHLPRNLGGFIRDLHRAGGEEA